TNIYTHITIYQDYDNIEIGFFLLSKLSYLMFGDNGIHFVFFVYSFFTYYFIFKSNNNPNNNQKVLLLIFITGFIFFSNNAIRQALSISIFLYASKFLLNHKIKYILIILLNSLLIHLSALLFMFALLAPKRKIKPIFLYCFLSISFIIYKLELIDLFLKNIISYIPIYSEIYYQRVIDFTSKEQGTGLTILLYFGIVAYVISKEHNVIYKKFNVFIIGVILFLAAPHIEMWERITIPFFYMAIIIIPSLYESSKLSFRYLKYKNIPLIVSAFLMSFLFFYQVVNNVNKNGVSPYEHVIFGKFE
ncbi:EpsG family protein, partial [Proteus mirabilis]